MLQQMQTRPLAPYKVYAVLAGTASALLLGDTVMGATASTAATTWRTKARANQQWRLF